jgi:hypothetical protein
MAELILSDITIMGPGYCVIGLEQVAPRFIGAAVPGGNERTQDLKNESRAACYRSVRPFPSWGFAWRDPFPFKRGDRVRCQLRQVTGLKPPHVEDQKSSGLIAIGASLTEDELLKCLKLSEVSSSLAGLFGCEITSASDWAPSWVNGGAGARSICGCQFRNIRFSVTQEPNRLTLRAYLVLPSGERRNNVPVVDREWKRFLEELMGRLESTEALAKAKRILNGPIRMKLLHSPNRFARLGLARPGQDAKCWLMLDSLFPQPDASWMAFVAPGVRT